MRNEKALRFLIFILAAFTTFALFGGVSVPLSRKETFKNCQPDSIKYDDYKYCFGVIQSSYFLTSKCDLVILHSQENPMTEGHGYLIHSPFDCESLKHSMNYDVSWNPEGVRLKLSPVGKVASHPDLVLDIPADQFSGARSF